MYKKLFKRLFDVILSLLGLVILLPILLIVSILVFIFLGKPVIFKQERVGKDGKLFTLYKFRSMSNKKDKDGNLLSDDKRLTKFGIILRKTSLDEIPEIINILKGDMSIVGPRPLMPEYLPYYTKEEFHRHDVLPGLTGLAQINGRNDISWEKRFEYDLEYVNNISFKNDIKIMFQTAKKVLKQENVTVRGEGMAVDFHTYRQQQNNKKRGKKSDK